MITKQEAGHAATGTAIASPVIGHSEIVLWVNEYYAIVWLGISGFSALMALVFYTLNYRENRKRTEHLLNGG